MNKVTQSSSLLLLFLLAIGGGLATSSSYTCDRHNDDRDPCCGDCDCDWITSNATCISLPGGERNDSDLCSDSGSLVGPVIAWAFLFFCALYCGIGIVVYWRRRGKGKNEEQVGMFVALKDFE